MPTSDSTSSSMDPSERLRQLLEGQKRKEHVPLIQVGPPEKEVFVQLALEGTSDQLVAIEILGYDGKPLVQVFGNGTIAYGDAYDPDEAAHIFWAAIAKHFSRNITTTSKDS